MGDPNRDHLQVFISSTSNDDAPRPPAWLLDQYRNVLAQLMSWKQSIDVLAASHHASPWPHGGRTGSEIESIRILGTHSPAKTEREISRTSIQGMREIDRMVTHIVLDERLNLPTGHELTHLLAAESTRCTALTFLTTSLDEYESSFLRSSLASHLPDLIRAARQENAQKRIQQLLEAVAPPDPLAELQLRMAGDTVALREKFFKENPVLTSQEVSARAGITAKNAYAAVHRWRSKNQVFAVTHGNQDLYPAFQFSFEGRPLPIIAELLAIFGQVPSRTAWDNALWFAAPNGWLSGMKPKDQLIENPKAVTRAAEQEILPDVE
jgi:hypothetical protein